MFVALLNWFGDPEDYIILCFSLSPGLHYSYCLLLHRVSASVLLVIGTLITHDRRSHDANYQLLRINIIARLMGIALVGIIAYLRVTEIQTLL